MEWKSDDIIVSFYVFDQRICSVMSKSKLPNFPYYQCRVYTDNRISWNLIPIFQTWISYISYPTTLILEILTSTMSFF